MSAPTRSVAHANAVEQISLHWIRLQHAPIDAESWRELRGHFGALGLLPQQGYAAQQLLRLAPSPAPPLPQFTSAPAALNTPEPAEAEALLHHPQTSTAQRWAATLGDWLQQCPGDWLSWLYLARLQDGTPGNPEAATRSCDALLQARSLEPIAGESLHWLGLWRLNGGDHQGAIQAFAELVDLRPLRHGSMLYLGEALLRAGNRPAAEVAFTRASASSNPAFLRLLAQRVYQHNYWQEAIAVLERADNLQPHQIDTLIPLARLHWDLYQLSTAENICNQILQLDPANADVRYLLNALPGRRGDAAAHLAAVEAHYSELGDPSSRLASSIAMASLYVDALSPEQVAQRHCELCAPIEEGITPTTTFSNELDPERPLRIGLVSGDFHRQHPVNLFMLPLLERLDAEQFRLTVFHTGTMHDEYTVRARNAAQTWIEAGGLDDQALHQRILEAQIDILIDLAGHTTSHRLGVFALRAAPVQATFLGYPHSTGLSRIDWLIGDPLVSPAEHAHLFSEGIAQLPGSVFCWSPVDDYPLPPPRPAEAPLVLGSFNNIMKLSPRTIALWAQVLHDLPDAQLLLKAPSLGDTSVIERFQGLFAEHGIDADRLRFEGPEGLELMMQRYGAIDIALDPTPYNGGTTTLQALWMGVPVVALAGGNFVSRMGASFLTTLGHPEWIAVDERHYRTIARELAEQLPAIRQGRAALRQQMAASGISDLDRYASHFQRLLRRLWHHHCSGDPSRLLPAQP
ncbi:MAG: tetratricopeptide repeat protein [Cyanobacteriota bacterium]|nr:tetratricopeptide repeat protein [Cyanobacteriota bacterium]